MDAIEAIKGRRSIRKYKNTVISREVLTDLIDCARYAPTGYNKQPWIFVVIDDSEVKNKLVQVAWSGKFMGQSGAVVAVLCEKAAETMVEDGCAAAENIILAARAHGLGSCWINALRKPHSEDIKKVIGAGEEYELISLIVLGYPAEEPTPKSKKSVEEVIRWNRFA